MKHKITVIKGDGIGPEIMDRALEVLYAVGKKYDMEFDLTEELMGGCAIDATGDPLPAKT